VTELARLLDDALATGDDAALRAHLVAHSALPGPRLDLRLVAKLARAVGDVVRRRDPPVDALVALLDGWAAMSADVVPVQQPEVILPCSAVLAYGEVGVARPDWWDDEIGKLRHAATDSRWRVREVVALAVQRLLDADWERAIRLLQAWAGDEDPLVVRAAAAAVAEPPLLRTPERATAAADVQRRAVGSLHACPADVRRSESVRVLRQALGFSVSVAVAATGDFSLLEGMATSGDPDLRWVVRENLKKARLQRWPQQVERVGRLLDACAGRDRAPVTPSPASPQWP
jgi:hypothetical protein